jgi:hypothetical protein
MCGLAIQFNVLNCYVASITPVLNTMNVIVRKKSKDKWRVILFTVNSYNTF